MSQYEQYAERSVLTASPIELVRILYRFVIDNLRDAVRSIEMEDIAGRGKAVSKATEGLMELLTSLDHQQGADVSKNLAELYGYMASRLLQGHIDQDRRPFEEVEQLMSGLLASWEQVDASPSEPIMAAYGASPESYTPISASF